MSEHKGAMDDSRKVGNTYFPDKEPFDLFNARYVRAKVLDAGSQDSGGLVTNPIGTVAVPLIGLDRAQPLGEQIRLLELRRARQRQKGWVGE